MQAKQDAGTQNNANASKTGCGHVKQCKCKQNRMRACKTMQMQAKQDAGTQNNANASKTGQMHATIHMLNVKLIRSYACKKARKGPKCN